MRTFGEHGHGCLDLICMTCHSAFSAGTQVAEECGKGQVWGIIHSGKKCLPAVASFPAVDQGLLRWVKLVASLLNISTLGSGQITFGPGRSVLGPGGRVLGQPCDGIANVILPSALSGSTAQLPFVLCRHWAVPVPRVSVSLIHCTAPPLSVSPSPPLPSSSSQSS